IVALMTVKYLMNSRYYFKHWLFWIVGVVALAAHAIGVFLHLPSPGVLTASAAPPDPAVLRGKTLFQTQTCATCHMQGSAQLGPSLYGIYGSLQELADGSSVTVDDAYLKHSILEPSAQIVKGFAPAMPSFAGKLDDEQLSDLIAYIRSLTPGAASPTP
ncbi:MAG: c-type cytochrome, partial [Chthoniobacterales bacterium]